MNNEPDFTRCVPYIAYESEMARMERIVKRLWVVLLAAVLLLAGTNAAWMWFVMS